MYNMFDISSDYRCIPPLVLIIALETVVFWYFRDVNLDECDINDVLCI